MTESGFSMAADIWAVGVTAFELLAGSSLRIPTTVYILTKSIHIVNFTPKIP